MLKKKNGPAATSLYNVYVGYMVLDGAPRTGWPRDAGNNHHPVIALALQHFQQLLLLKVSTHSQLQTLVSLAMHRWLVQVEHTWEWRKAFLHESLKMAAIYLEAKPKWWRSYGWGPKDPKKIPGSWENSRKIRETLRSLPQYLLTVHTSLHKNWDSVIEPCANHWYHKKRKLQGKPKRDSEVLSSMQFQRFKMPCTWNSSRTTIHIIAWWCRVIAMVFPLCRKAENCDIKARHD